MFEAVAWRRSNSHPLAPWSLLVVGGMALNIGFFVAATLVMWARSNSTENALSAATNGVPSVRYAAAARTHLREYREAASAFMFDGGGARARDELRRSRLALETAIVGEFTTPEYPGEREVEVRAAAVLTELEDTERTLQPSQSLDETWHRFQALQAAADRLDGELVGLEDHNAAFLQSDVSMVVARERSARSFVLLLDGISILLAATITLIMVRLLRRYVQTIESRNRELEMFSARVAHDVIGPLATVSLALEVARGDLRDERKVRMTVAALSALKRSRAVVDALLDFARAGGGRRPDARAPVRLVLEGVFEDAGPAAERARIELSYESFPDCEVACEPGVLTVLLSNLINNAIKFMGDSPIRKIVVRVRAGGMVSFDVEDTGPGFPDSLTPTIFDPYARASSRAPGLGLGLATVKRLVEAHGGKVGVVPRREGQCTRFWFELPIAGHPRPVTAPSLSPQPA